MCIEWPQNDLKLYKVKCTHNCVTSIHKSKILLHFAVRWADFEIQAIMRQVHRMTPIDIEPYKVKLPLYV